LGFLADPCTNAARQRVAKQLFGDLPALLPALLTA
jgi:hypothetical protein